MLGGGGTGRGGRGLGGAVAPRQPAAQQGCWEGWGLRGPLGQEALQICLSRGQHLWLQHAAAPWASALHHTQLACGP